MKKYLSILMMIIIVPIAVFTQQTGFLDIDSTPSGAQIYINNNYHGQTPNFITLPVGNHALEIRYQDYESQRLQISIRRNEVHRHSITLREARGFQERPPDDRVIEQARGNLTVMTEPPDATVFIDGIEVRQKTPFTIYDVGAGERRIRIRQRMGAPLDDYLDIELRATIKANDTELLRVNLYEYLRSGTLNLNTNVSRTEVTLRDITRNRDRRVSAPVDLELINGSYEVIWEDNRRQSLRFEIRPDTRTTVYLPIQEAYLPLLKVSDHPDYISQEEYIRRNAKYLPEREYLTTKRIRPLREIYSYSSSDLQWGKFLTYFGPVMIGLGIIYYFSEDKVMTEESSIFVSVFGVGLLVAGILLRSEEYREPRTLSANVKYNLEEGERLLQRYRVLHNQWTAEIDIRNNDIRNKNSEIEQRNQRLPRATVNYSEI